ncbi:hypothetical protein DPMN_044082 [Dreissena polymorpha]|uniref:Uncharacterized protein n=1 Tax=Dreissena polymorpha TaxID=45954 RepID=A0A9D4D3H4_DREPO|nr:hypothetical protein DPMN_044082 [Dreissena polymorpha]
MLDKLGWRSLENRRYDSRLLMFYKIVHGLVAVPMPPYVTPPTRLTRHLHPLSFRQIPTPPVCRSAAESYGILWKSLDGIPWSIGTNFPSDSMQSMEK